MHIAFTVASSPSAIAALNDAAHPIAEQCAGRSCADRDDALQLARAECA